MCRTPKISIHPPRAGRDLLVLTERLTRFISIHPPRAGRDHLHPAVKWLERNFNPPAPCGAGHKKAVMQTLEGAISIHPPRAGRDDGLHRGCIRTQRISIHPPRAGRDVWCSTMIFAAAAFQSTRPVRGGTKNNGYVKMADIISIHPPRAGRDLFSQPCVLSNLTFQSTRPVRGGTRYKHT